MSNFLQIQTFIEVANSKSFAEAGRKLSIPKSTISARIKALEERLNTRLLFRNTRNVTLTDEGQIYLRSCQNSLSALLEIEEELSQKNKLSGRIRVTVPIDLSKKSLAEIAHGFTSLYPEVIIEIDVNDQVHNLISNQFDLAIRAKSPGSLGLITRKLGESKMHILATPKYMKKYKAKFDLADHHIFDPCQALLKTNSQTRIETSNFELAKVMTSLSIGVGILPENMCSDEIQKGSLVKVNVNVKLPLIPVYIVYGNKVNLPMRVRRFIDYLVSQQSKWPLY